MLFAIGLRLVRTRSAEVQAARRTAAVPTSTALHVELLETRTVLDAATLLIGTWNVDIADTGGANRDAAAFQEVFRALGQEGAYAQPQPLDLLTVTEVR